MAVAWRHFEIAIVLSLLNFATLRYVADLKQHVRRSDADADSESESESESDAESPQKQRS